VLGMVVCVVGVVGVCASACAGACDSRGGPVPAPGWRVGEESSQLKGCIVSSTRPLH